MGKTTEKFGWREYLIQEGTRQIEEEGFSLEEKERRIAELKKKVANQTSF
jgi:hypothetical protein